MRGLASGAAATANWAANAAVSQTFLALTAALGGSGAFWLYAAVAAAGAAWVYVALPETKGASSLPCAGVLHFQTQGLRGADSEKTD